MIFFGIASRPARIAILGPGGYGKTTLANAVLTDDPIREHFGDARYFVTCESIFSCEALLIELGKTLGVLEGPPNALWPRICSMLSTRESILCLDNFESPWDQSSEIKHSVEELLSRITVLSQVTILLTMRGVERPARTQWSQPFLDPLDTYGQEASKQVWQGIAGNYNEYAEKLAAAVGYVPLAIDLLAHLSEMRLPMLLWEEWNSKGTKMIQRDKMHRLSNLEYSVQLSINSERMKVNPTAKCLLGVLSMLPDGLHIMQLKTFQDMLTGVDITSCLWILQQCSLIKLTDKRYQLHPIVRHFCRSQGIISSMHKAMLEDLYITWASLPFKDSPEAYEKMMSEMNNIKAVLTDLLGSNYKDQSKLIDASINLTWFQSKIGNHSDQVISQAVQFVQKSHGAMELLIESLTLWGKVYLMARNIEQAQEKLREAEKLCLSSLDVNSPLYSNVLCFLGQTFWLQDALKDAMACYERALKICKCSGDILCQGYLLNALGYIYIRQGQFDKAITSQQNALKCHMNNIMGQGNSYRCLGEIYIRKNMLVEAEAAIQKALEFYKASNEVLCQGNTHLSLGRMFLKLNQLDKAAATCQKALEIHIAVNDPWNQGHDHYELGNTYLSQGELDKAEKSYMIALELHRDVKSLWGEGNVIYGLGRVYMERQQLEKAKGMFEAAIVLHSKSQDILAAQEDQEYLSKLLT